MHHRIALALPLLFVLATACAHQSPAQKSTWIAQELASELALSEPQHVALLPVTQQIVQIKETQPDQGRRVEAIFQHLTPDHFNADGARADVQAHAQGYGSPDPAKLLSVVDAFSSFYQTLELSQRHTMARLATRFAY